MTAAQIAPTYHLGRGHNGLHVKIRVLEVDDTLSIPLLVHEHVHKSEQRQRNLLQTAEEISSKPGHHNLRVQ